MSIKNPYLFISQSDGKPMDTSNLIITASLPRMLPKNVNIKDIKDQAKKAG